MIAGDCCVAPVDLLNAQSLGELVFLTVPMYPAALRQS